MRQIFQIKITTFILVMSAYFTLCFNYPILAKIFDLSHSVSNVLFPYTAPIVLMAAFIIIFTLLCWPYLFKPVMIFLTITSSMALYAEVNYHTLFNNAVIESIFETNSDEAFSPSRINTFLTRFIFMKKRFKSNVTKYHNSRFKHKI
ncbi:phosphoethanolamine transferase domain-containing protein [Photobacterium leiognathi]|uniref:phosphoethanolamine transferase domain-containing protein n=1 Tax=Photobacterium leiognathi TaxID=553611 RepID=UPI0027339E61|nr:phosphoethanolamine transferase domain-containing protein [Photobacterium leiognathi]